MTRPIIAALSADVPQNGQPDAEFDQNADRWVDEQLAFQTDLNAWGAWAEGLGIQIDQDAFDAGQAASSAAEDAGFALQAKDDAEAARDVVVPLSQQFGASYLGAYAGAPLVDKNGDPLADGMLYTETGVSPGLKLRLGGAWVAAAIDANGANLKVNNLSDVPNKATARTNLELAYASQAEAEAGTSQVRAMNPLRVAQAIAFLGQIAVTKNEFLANGTWSKPTKAKFVIVEAWGAGGGGGVGTGAKGGGGGAYQMQILLASDLAATVAVTIGNGGAASATTALNAGGSTTFGAHVTARGGNWNGSGTSGVSGAYMNGSTDFFESAGGTGAANGNGSTNHGGGGGTYNSLGGLSVRGGNGGNGSSTGTAQAGAVPGGGGGSTNTGTAAAGGKGKMIVWTIG